MIKHILARIRWNGLADLHQKRHISRIRVLLQAMTERFPHLKHPQQVQLKHVRWLRVYWLTRQDLAISTLTDYKRSMALLIGALNADGHWEYLLKIARDPRKGGRPATCRAVKTRRHR